MLAARTAGTVAESSHLDWKDQARHTHTLGMAQDFWKLKALYPARYTSYSKATSLKPPQTVP